MAKTLTEMAVEIAAAQSSHAGMSAEEIEVFLTKTFQVLKQIKSEEEGAFLPEGAAGEATGQAQAEPMDPKKSIQRNKVICLECGSNSLECKTGMELLVKSIEGE